MPLLDGALDLVERNTPGGGRTNQEHFGGGRRERRAGLDPRRVQLLYDPQTSGGLLVAVAPEAVAAAALAALRAPAVAAHRGVEPKYERPRTPGLAAVAVTLALNGINLRLACFRTCLSSGSFSSSWS